jgi:hypothetical protein
VIALQILFTFVAIWKNSLKLHHQNRLDNSSVIFAITLESLEHVFGSLSTRLFCFEKLQSMVPLAGVDAWLEEHFGGVVGDIAGLFLEISKKSSVLYVLKPICSVTNHVV